MIPFRECIRSVIRNKHVSILTHVALTKLSVSSCRKGPSTPPNISS